MAYENLTAGNCFEPPRSAIEEIYYKFAMLCYELKELENGASVVRHMISRAILKCASTNIPSVQNNIVVQY